MSMVMINGLPMGNTFLEPKTGQHSGHFFDVNRDNQRHRFSQRNELTRTCEDLASLMFERNSCLANPCIKSFLCVTCFTKSSRNPRTMPVYKLLHTEGPIEVQKRSLCAARHSNKRKEQKHEPNNRYSVVWRRCLDVLPLKEWCIHQRPTPLNMEGRNLAHLSVSEHTTEKTWNRMIQKVVSETHFLTAESASPLPTKSFRKVTRW